MRLAMGWFFFYAGITKLLDPSWTAAGYLNQAKIFPELFGWLASPANIGWVNFLNEWGLVLIGAALILGILVRFVSYWGILLMILYYLPILKFPYAGENYFIINDHIIYLLVFVIFITTRAGSYWGLDKVRR